MSELIVPNKVVFTDHLIWSWKHPFKLFNGMNFWAAKELGIKFPYPEDTMLIYKKMSGDQIRMVILHEQIESRFMQNGMIYAAAHEQTRHPPHLSYLNCVEVVT
jgi:hypothetical protein